MSWNDERVAALKQMWADGLYASAISKVLGVSSNAVIGKVNRLGLEKRKETPAGKPSSQRPISVSALARRRGSGGRPRVRYRTKGKRPLAPPKPPKPPKANIIQIIDHDIPLEQRRTLDTITNKDCHFPVGDPGQSDFFYCGAPIHGERPYCLGHQQRMYTEPRPRHVAPNRTNRPFKALSAFRINPAFRRSQG